MKTLFVLRHAKSSWEDPDLADFDRPLNDRGNRAAPFMGEVMRQRDLEPEVILSSPAVRARETARLVKENGDIEARIVFDERIYEASVHTLRQVASAVDEKFRSVMVVGHNPGMEGIVRYLTGLREAMPTASLAIIDLDISNWSELAPETGTLRAVIRPKDEMKTFGKGN
ncbi:MAG TPA: histidine phosphatase family protein [Pyrinomonadaceae bacterium]|nr:histidine phosphatase family protein [Pyrinomonadaceae bacterium]